MAAKKYVVSSPEGAEHHQVEEGAELELELEQRSETAQIAAGWLTPADAKKGGKG